MDISVDNWKKWEHMRARYLKHKWSPIPSSKHVELDSAGDNISVLSTIFQSQRSMGDCSTTFSGLFAPLILAYQIFMTN